MFRLAVALSAISLLVACSGGTSAPTSTPTITAPTASPSVEERIATAYPQAVNIDTAMGEWRTNTRQLYVSPGFQTETFCRSLQGLSDDAAWVVFGDTFEAYGFGRPNEQGPHLNAAKAAILKEECARMYPPP